MKKRVKRTFRFTEDGCLAITNLAGTESFKAELTLDQAIELYEQLKTWLDKTTFQLVHQGIIDVLKEGEKLRNKGPRVVTEKQEQKK